ncbi:hypothetical protein B0T18DRAFT_426230 [Schizothecium vesticola]|uniref:Uncharacterized protein n=1 Tax=Schizothecium vesticola TaxID=314040 RepID=A0AA40F5K4_9PEZI|nr:hypothetical protein B0T18DRAFT_426230 [Schizothecium vesticola]
MTFFQWTTSLIARKSAPPKTQAELPASVPATALPRPAPSTPHIRTSEHRPELYTSFPWEPPAAPDAQGQDETIRLAIATRTPGSEASTLAAWTDLELAQRRAERPAASATAALRPSSRRAPRPRTPPAPPAFIPMLPRPRLPSPFSHLPPSPRSRPSRPPSAPPSQWAPPSSPPPPPPPPASYEYFSAASVADAMVRILRAHGWAGAFGVGILRSGRIGRKGRLEWVREVGWADGREDGGDGGVVVWIYREDGDDQGPLFGGETQWRGLTAFTLGREKVVVDEVEEAWQAWQEEEMMLQGLMIMSERRNGFGFSQQKELVVERTESLTAEQLADSRRFASCW